jgi:hypothetical protein
MYNDDIYQSELYVIHAVVQTCAKHYFELKLMGTDTQYATVC